jgi:palmitoyltransferase ZDHHC1/11
VHHFDHHCGWINNCIGAQNYKSFFVMIVSALLYFILFCVAVGLLYAEAVWESFKGAIITGWIFFSIALIFAVLLTILVGLHIYLNFLGVTTFQFIMMKRI